MVMIMHTKHNIPRCHKAEQGEQRSTIYCIPPYRVHIAPPCEMHIAAAGNDSSDAIAAA
jgi:hypothetical protein